MKKTSDDLVIDEESAKVLMDKTTSFLKKNRMVLAVSLIIAIIIVSGTITITALQKSRDEKSSFLLSEIMDLIKNDSNSGSSMKAIEEKIKDLKKNYSSAESVKIAELVFASYLYDIKKYEEAAKSYDASFNYMKKDSLFGRIAKAGAGYSYMMIKDNKKAVSSFEEITSSDLYLAKDEAFFNKGLAHKALGEQDKYRDSFLNTIKANENSLYNQIVKEKFPG